MTLYDIIPENLFSVLASKNKGIYCSALFVVFEAFKAHLKIPKDELAYMIEGKMSLAEFEELSQRERDEFARCAALLTARTFIFRDTAESTLSREYSFIQRKFSLFEEYLELSGWKLYYDKMFGVIYVRNVNGYNKAVLNKLTTQIIITLRLIFEEKRLNGIVALTMGELWIKMMNELTVLRKKPPQKEIKEAMRVLEQHNIIYKLGESYGDIDCRIRVLPSILLAFPNERCNSICESLRAEIQEDESETDDKGSAD